MIQQEAKRFLIVGAGATLINYSVFLVLYTVLSVHYQVSYIGGFLSGVLVGYIFNKPWTFQIEHKNPMFIWRYIFAYIMSLILGSLLLNLQVKSIGIPVLLANFICISFTTITNFISTKFWVFKV